MPRKVIIVFFQSLVIKIEDAGGHNSDVTITNDGATILKMLEVEHNPAAKKLEMEQLQLEADMTKEQKSAYGSKNRPWTRRTLV
ncbi:T-complex protein 1 subunit alpha [Linum grandiflorum]